MYVTEKQRIAQGERLKEFRKAMGLSQQVFSDLLEMGQGSYSDIERGKNGLSNFFLIKLLENTQVNINWLITGVGSMDREKLDEGEGLMHTKPADSDKKQNQNIAIKDIEEFLKRKFPDFGKE